MRGGITIFPVREKIAPYGFRMLNQCRDILEMLIFVNTRAVHRAGVDEDQHLKNIATLIEHAESIGGDLLADGKYSYAAAQKLLNLALKYYWCRGKIKDPPHCPVDRIILSIAKSKANIKWTQITDENGYLKAIGEIKNAPDLNGRSLARYELEKYGRRANKDA